jgi:hypothetical protein
MQMTNLIDQAKTLMQGCGCHLQQAPFVETAEKCGQRWLGGIIHCSRCKAKASQMLIDLTNEREFLGLIYSKELMSRWILNKCKDRLKEINSAIEILEGK